MSLSEFKIRFTVSILTIAALVMFLPSFVNAAKSAEKKSEKTEQSFDGSAFESREYDFGLVVGLWLPGTISVEDIDLDKSEGPLIRAFLDAYLIPKFAVGCYFNYSTVSLSYESVEASANFYEFGVSLKPRFFLSPVAAIKPGINIGYRKETRERLEGESADTETGSDGMGLNLSVEVQYMIDSDYILFFEGGFLSQPTGGNSDASVTWAPIMYLACGLCF